MLAEPTVPDCFSVKNFHSYVQNFFAVSFSGLIACLQILNFRSSDSEVLCESNLKYSELKFRFEIFKKSGGNGLTSIRVDSIEVLFSFH